jgi:hypothetical protein
LQAAFSRAEQKSAKKTLMTLLSFAILGSASIKVVHKNVDEIDPWCQFHQHFMLVFFIHKCFAQLFSNYSLAL